MHPMVDSEKAYPNSGQPRIRIASIGHPHIVRRMPGRALASAAWASMRRPAACGTLEWL